jgi:fatty acid synthase subunit alpha
MFNQEAELIRDLDPSKSQKRRQKRSGIKHSDKCNIWAGKSDQWFVKLKKGACIFVLKAFEFS